MSEPSAPNPVGRPTKYEARFCDELIAFMGEGYSLTAFAGSISVARSTINEWMGANPEFSEAAKIGQARRTMALEKTLIAGETGPKVTGHMFALKNADPEGWKDRRETELSGRVEYSNLTEEEIDARLAALAANGSAPPTA